MRTPQILRNVRGTTSFLAIPVLASMLLAIGAVSRAEAQDASPVTFSLSRVEARAGDVATLVLSVDASVPILTLSVAIDFDESKVRALAFRRIAQVVPGQATTAPDDFTSADVSNTDQVLGNQASEGWLHLELSNVALPLDLSPAGLSPIIEVQFLVLPDAPPGFTPVVFRDVEGGKGAPAAAFKNQVELVEKVGALQDVEPDSLDSGGIDIIGEVGFFMRGDANFDRKRDIADPIRSITYLFVGGTAFPCAEAADANDDGRIDLSDPIFTLERLFDGSGSFPAPEAWGADPTPDDLGCAIYPGH
jgi:hypothetical protein